MVGWQKISESIPKKERTHFDPKDIEKQFVDHLIQKVKSQVGAKVNGPLTEGLSPDKKLAVLKAHEQVMKLYEESYKQAAKSDPKVFIANWRKAFKTQSIVNYWSTHSKQKGGSLFTFIGCSLLTAPLAFIVGGPIGYLLVIFGIHFNTAGTMAASHAAAAVGTGGLSEAALFFTCAGTSAAMAVAFCFIESLGTNSQKKFIEDFVEGLQDKTHIPFPTSLIKVKIGEYYVPLPIPVPATLQKESDDEDTLLFSGALKLKPGLNYMCIISKLVIDEFDENGSPIVDPRIKMYEALKNDKNQFVFSEESGDFEVKCVEYNANTKLKRSNIVFIFSYDEQNINGQKQYLFKTEDYEKKVPQQTFPTEEIMFKICFTLKFRQREVPIDSFYEIQTQCQKEYSEQYILLSDNWKQVNYLMDGLGRILMPEIYKKLQKFKVESNTVYIIHSFIFFKLSDTDYEVYIQAHHTSAGKGVHINLYNNAPFDDNGDDITKLYQYVIYKNKLRMEMPEPVFNDPIFSFNVTDQLLKKVKKDLCDLNSILLNEEKFKEVYLDLKAPIELKDTSLDIAFLLKEAREAATKAYSEIAATMKKDIQNKPEIIEKVRSNFYMHDLQIMNDAISEVTKSFEVDIFDIIRFVKDTVSDYKVEGINMEDMYSNVCTIVKAERQYASYIAMQNKDWIHPEKEYVCRLVVLNNLYHSSLILKMAFDSVGNKERVSDEIYRFFTKHLYGEREYSWKTMKVLF